jgi:hypothetical protein
MFGPRAAVWGYSMHIDIKAARVAPGRAAEAFATDLPARRTRWAPAATALAAAAAVLLASCLAVIMGLS